MDALLHRRSGIFSPGLSWTSRSIFRGSAKCLLSCSSPRSLSKPLRRLPTLPSSLSPSNSWRRPLTEAATSSRTPPPGFLSVWRTRRQSAHNTRAATSRRCGVLGRLACRLLGYFHQLTVPQVLVAGAGPIGLRVAIEMRALGHSVTLIETRNTCSRLNILKVRGQRFALGFWAHVAALPAVCILRPSTATRPAPLILHSMTPHAVLLLLVYQLWPETTDDLEQLGLPMVDPKWCTKHGGYTTASTSRLQLALLKVALLFGATFKVHRASPASHKRVERDVPRNMRRSSAPLP